MAFDRERMMFNRVAKDVELHVPVVCTTCARHASTKCQTHDAGVEDVPIKVAGIPWAKLNYIKSQCVSYNDKQETQFDGQQYINECLKIMVVDAPWGATDDIFLLQVGSILGAELEKLIPSAYGANEEEEESASDIKKE
jgi:hypothetical protein|tara:strand:+ start:547 stop:963 length:417 start_codon:yes stop_codon:yes gene_type:complete